MDRQFVQEGQSGIRFVGWSHVPNTSGQSYKYYTIANCDSKIVQKAIFLSVQRLGS